MNLQAVPTDERMSTIFNSGKGIEFGVCDVCGEECSEHFILSPKRVVVRFDGKRFLESASADSHGHRACLIDTYGQAIEAGVLKRVDGLLIAPI